MTAGRRGMTAPVLVLGDINVDALLAIPAYPAPGGDALATRSTIRAGGSASNTASVLAKLGLAPHLLARAGQDAWGDLALAELGAAGVQTEAVQRDAAAATGLFVIPVTPDGERTMFGLRGANTRLDPAGLPPALFAEARWLHLSGYALLEAPQREAALRAVDLAARHGVPISLDSGRPPAQQAGALIRTLLPRLALCVLDDAAARALTGAADPEAAAETLTAAGVGLVGLTLGAAGGLLRAGADTVRQPAFPVAVADTTGAGDAFSAGLIYARLRGLSLPAAAALAAALGALAVQVWGAGPALPGGAEAAAFLRGQAGAPAAEALAGLVY